MTVLGILLARFPSGGAPVWGLDLEHNLASQENGGVVAPFCNTAAAVFGVNCSNVCHGEPKKGVIDLYEITVLRNRLPPSTARVEQWLDIARKGQQQQKQQRQRVRSIQEASLGARL